MTIKLLVILSITILVMYIKSHRLIFKSQPTLKQQNSLDKFKDVFFKKQKRFHRPDDRASQSFKDDNNRFLKNDLVNRNIISYNK